MPGTQTIWFPPEQLTAQLSPLRGRYKTSETFKQSWSRSPSPDRALGLRLPDKAPGGDTEVPPPSLLHTIWCVFQEDSANGRPGRALLLAPWRTEGSGECRPVATADAQTRGGHTAAALAPAQMWLVLVTKVQGSSGS